MKRVLLGWCAAAWLTPAVADARNVHLQIQTEPPSAEYAVLVIRDSRAPASNPYVLNAAMGLTPRYEVQATVGDASTTHIDVHVCIYWEGCACGDANGVPLAARGDVPQVLRVRIDAGGMTPSCSDAIEDARHEGQFRSIAYPVLPSGGIVMQAGVGSARTLHAFRLGVGPRVLLGGGGDGLPAVFAPALDLSVALARDPQLRVGADLELAAVAAAPSGLAALGPGALRARLSFAAEVYPSPSWFVGMGLGGALALWDLPDEAPLGAVRISARTGLRLLDRRAGSLWLTASVGYEYYPASAWPHQVDLGLAAAWSFGR